MTKWKRAGSSDSPDVGDDRIRLDLKNVQGMTDFEVDTVTTLFVRVASIEALTRYEVACLWRDFSRERAASWLKLSDDRIRAFSEWVTTSPMSRTLARRDLK